MECLPGGFSTTATPHGGLYATDLALLNPHPVGLAPAPPSASKGQAGAPETHKNTLFCTQLLPLLSTPHCLSGISLLRPTGRSSAWTQIQDLGFGHSCFQLSALFPRGSVLSFLFHPGLLELQHASKVCSRRGKRRKVCCCTSVQKHICKKTQSLHPLLGSMRIHSRHFLLDHFWDKSFYQNRKKLLLPHAETEPTKSDPEMKNLQSYRECAAPQIILDSETERFPKMCHYLKCADTLKLLGS